MLVFKETIVLRRPASKTLVNLKLEGKWTDEKNCWLDISNANL